MEVGPVEIVMIKFPGTELSGTIAPAIKDLTDRGVIRIIDALFMQKDAEGHVSIKEFGDLEDPEYEAFDPVIEDVTGLLSEQDAEEMADEIEPNSSAALMLFEHTWAIELRDALDQADGRLLMSERIPREAVQAALAAATRQDV
jgi:hypothetical protein